MRTLPKKNLEPTLDESYIYTPLSYLKIYNELKDYIEVQSYCNQILQLIKLHRPSDKLLHNFYRILDRVLPAVPAIFFCQHVYQNNRFIKQENR